MCTRFRGDCVGQKKSSAAERVSHSPFCARSIGNQIAPEIHSAVNAEIEFHFAQPVNECFHGYAVVARAAVFVGFRCPWEIESDYFVDKIAAAQNVRSVGL